jgi:hypothetical protein
MYTLRRPSRGALGAVALLALLAVGAVACGGGGTQAAEESGIPPELVVDYIHTVIEADRTTYASQVVHRLQDVEGVIEAHEHFEEEKALPLPAQMLRMGAQRASENGIFRYALISRWAINKANLPKTDFERQGFDRVVSERQPYRAVQEVGGKRYYMAMYPDFAVSPACVKCHNDHPESPRSDFELDDVMGAVVIALPLG